VITTTFSQSGNYSSMLALMVSKSKKIGVGILYIIVLSDLNKASENPTTNSISFHTSTNFIYSIQKNPF
jgi:hypothetical protein